MNLATMNLTNLKLADFFHNSIRNYLFLSFGRLFFIFFIILFFISSIVILIGIAQVTFVVKMSFADLFWLYLYSLPNSILFILPITFLATAILSLSKLSYDYELLVFFSLGISPNQIIAPQTNFANSIADYHIFKNYITNLCHLRKICHAIF